MFQIMRYHAEKYLYMIHETKEKVCSVPTEKIFEAL